MNKRKDNINIRISKEDHQLLKKLAKESKRTLKAMIGLILEIYYRAK